MTTFIIQLTEQQLKDTRAAIEAAGHSLGIGAYEVLGALNRHFVENATKVPEDEDAPIGQSNADRKTTSRKTKNG